MSPDWLSEVPVHMTGGASSWGIGGFFNQSIFNDVRSCPFHAFNIKPFQPFTGSCHIQNDFIPVLLNAFKIKKLQVGVETVIMPLFDRLVAFVCGKKEFYCSVIAEKPHTFYQVPLFESVLVT
jgi:hypothetical protein